MANLINIIKADGKLEYDFIDKTKDRSSAVEDKVIKAVTDIIDNVRKNGDKAIREYTEKFDNVKLESFEVSAKDIEDAYKDCNITTSLELASKNIYEYHKKQKQNGYTVFRDGVCIGQRVRGLNTVGIYVPGGTAAYPSSVLMNAIPAKVAGVKNIIMVTPPSKDGNVDKNILAAAYIAGVDKVYSIGGAQAVAGICLGTETLPKVDKIVGPGNIYVATAKRLLYGTVDIDMIAGPSEILIIADERAREDYLAADMLSQAEHDKLASSILLCKTEEMAYAVEKELELQLDKLSRKEMAMEALANSSAIIVCPEKEKALELANLLAPEHLELMVEEPFEYLDYIDNAGSVFLGENSPEPLGDYVAGPNHVLPTSGTARVFSPLSVDSFIKKSSYIYYSYSALEKVKDDIINIAEQEGLDAHAAAIKVRFND